jgi:DNA-binding NarL/FixJ family response regulator
MDNFMTDWVIRLNPTEKIVLDILLTGDSIKHISNKLDIEPRTAKAHICNILHKSGGENRYRLMALFIKRAEL